MIAELFVHTVRELVGQSIIVADSTAESVAELVVLPVEQSAGAAIYGTHCAPGCIGGSMWGENKKKCTATFPTWENQ